jgi:hypothetical protein
VVLHEGVYANVYVDDRKLAVTAPFRKLELPGGRHTIQVVNHQARINDVRIVYVDGHDVVIELGEEGEAGPTASSPWDLSPEVEDTTPWVGDGEAPGDEATSPREEDDRPPEIRGGDDLWVVPWLLPETEEAEEAEEPEEETPSRRRRRREEREEAPAPAPEEEEEEVIDPWGAL